MIKNYIYEILYTYFGGDTDEMYEMCFIGLVLLWLACDLFGWMITRYTFLLLPVGCVLFLYMTYLFDEWSDSPLTDVLTIGVIIVASIVSFICMGNINREIAIQEAERKRQKRLQKQKK